MTSPSATPLPIRTEPTLINFHVAELRVAGMPKTAFNFNFYHGDPFREYCDDTLAKVLANLLINKVVVCQTMVTVVPFLFIFKQRVSYDYYSVTTPSLTAMGRVEKSILRVLWGLSKPLPTTKLIDRVITDLVGTSEPVVNPWREIFRSVIESNYPDAWTFTYRKTLLGKRLDVVLKPALEKSLYDQRWSIEQMCTRERSENPEFDELFSRISEVVKRTMRAHWDEPDGGS